MDKDAANNVNVDKWNTKQLPFILHCVKTRYLNSQSKDAFVADYIRNYKNHDCVTKKVIRVVSKICYFMVVDWKIKAKDNLL